MKIVLYLIVLVLFFIVFSCKSTKDINFENYEGTKLIFGNSGGFAGTTTSYSLFENGMFYYKGPRSKNFSQIPTVDDAITKQIFNNYSTLALGDLKLDNPGNLSYFLKMKTKEGTKKIVWGGNREEVPENLRIFFVNLMRLAKDQNAKKEEQEAVLK